MMRTLALCSVAVFAGSASAAIQNYGNLMSDNFMYLDVTESSSEATVLFGAPSTSGDALVFSPLSFAASSSGGGADIVDSQIATTVMAKPGQFITDIVISEAGDYTLIGAGGAGTSAGVGLAVFVTILEVDGVGINATSTSASGSFSPSGGSFDLANDGPGTAVIWNGSASIDIAAFLASQNISGNATKVLLTFDNTLIATSEANTSSFIKKKQVDGVTINVIPTPAAFALLGLGGLAGTTRRRR